MARVLENVGKDLLKKSGIPTPRYVVVEDGLQAKKAAEELGYPIVVKALVTVGKRDKAGAVKFAANAEEVEAAAKSILNMTVRNFPVEKLLIEQKLDIEKELYISVAYDEIKQAPIIIASSEGGVDIEEIAEKYPDRIIQHSVDILNGFHAYQAKEISAALGLTGKMLQMATQVIYRVYNFFVSYDATVVEINPLALTSEGNLVAAAILMGVDDDALYRQPE